MVQIVGCRECSKEDGSKFYLLELQGGIEMVVSKTTGQFYATAKKAMITSTFDEVTCKALIGTQMKGSIVKQEVAPYEYVIKETGEEIILTHKWVYTPDEAPNVKKLFKADHSVFSQNGVNKLEEELV
ncbi:hypothetical protein [Tenacibaculum singaporense]|uniref:Uncharacterized protein n=1 Tax=Tenacibaculum singaporense TaxID=2358479 RepID=A0A3S5HI94_9FLAO|nr:hypothetical protein [Tenacibaculum singaporense]AZJ36876.1 hypothetical protein D6T69_15555 [Tenacibaculum singaporense]